MEGLPGAEPDARRLRRGWQAARGAYGKLASLWRLLDEHGDAIEADLLRFYRVDVLDFYRGTLSLRRLGVLIRHLPIESALVRALNDGVIPWGNVEHLLADHWALTLQVNSGERARFRDHPVRAEREAKARTTAKLARVVELRTKFEKRKQTYGLG